MKIFLILLTLSVCFSLFYLRYWRDEDYEISITNAKKRKRTNLLINRILPIFCIFLIILFIVFGFCFKFIIGFIFLIAIAIGLFAGDTWSTFYGIFYILIAFIIITLVYLFFPINEETKEPNKQEIILYSSSDSDSNKSIIIDITTEGYDDEDDDDYDEDSKLYYYTIMEYNKEDVEGIKIPSNLDELDSYKITKDSENKIEIVTEDVCYNTILSHFGFLKPFTFTHTKYNLYINESNVKTHHTKIE